MPDTRLVATHYTHGSLLDAITSGVAKLGRTPDTILTEELGPVDEFHIGGRVATESFLDQLDLGIDDQALDVGCGIGGASRFAAERYGCKVSGIDLTPEYIETGKALCSWVGLEDRVTLHNGDATQTPFDENSFDKAFMLHVGMNLADKSSLAAELFRVLRPAGILGIYDIMRVGNGELTYPVPWAGSAEGSAVGSPDDYREALEKAGFRISSERNRRDFALDFFRELQGRTTASAGPPPLGLHILMGETAPLKISNMIENISENRLAPVELILEKPLRT